MRLIIAEKPTVAEKIAAALGKNTRKAVGGVAYYEVPGKNAVVAPAVGHLFSLHQKTPGSGYPVFEIEWVPGFEADKKSDYSKKYYILLKKLAKIFQHLLIEQCFLAFRVDHTIIRLLQLPCELV